MWAVLAASWLAGRSVPVADGLRMSAAPVVGWLAGPGVFHAGDVASPDPTADPVLAKRERIRHWCALGQRVGYTLLLVFTVAAFVGLVTGFPSWLTTIAWVSVGLATVILAPAIVFSYAVKAADRADREDDW